MEYKPPFGSADPNAPYVDRNTPGATSGSVPPAPAIEHPQREIVNAILDAGLTPDDGDLTQLSQAIAQMIRNIVPAGAGMVWYADMPPTGWLEADGALLSRAAYADLFSAIGTTFGAGDGATTFALPDLRGEFLRGWDHGRGADPGRAFGSYQTSSLNLGRDVRAMAYGFPTEENGGNDMNNYPLSYIVTDDFPTTPGGANGAVISPAGGETRPRNVTTMIIIKF